MTDSTKVIDLHMEAADGRRLHDQMRMFAEEISAETPTVTLDEVAADAQVIAFLKAANRQLAMLGYTEHGERHANLVAHIAYNIFNRLGYSERICNLAAIAGYLHDSGNVVHRHMHAQSGALIAMHVLSRLGMSYDEMALVMGAIGNHEEERAIVTSPIAAAVIIADKSDVHRSRVQETDLQKHDIHDRVNNATKRSFVRVDAARQTITLELDIDTEVAGIMAYFEIFIERMVIARRAAEFLGCDFELIVNDVALH